MTIYHVRPMDLHAPGEHCNTYDCTPVMMASELRRCPVCDRWINKAWRPFLTAVDGHCAYCLIRTAEGKSECLG